MGVESKRGALKYGQSGTQLSSAWPTHALITDPSPAPAVTVLGAKWNGFGGGLLRVGGDGCGIIALPCTTPHQTSISTCTCALMPSPLPVRPLRVRIEETWCPLGVRFVRDWMSDWGEVGSLGDNWAILTPICFAISLTLLSATADDSTCDFAHSRRALLAFWCRDVHRCGGTLHRD